MIELGGFDWVLTVLRYGPWWRRHRRAFHRFFNVNAVASYHSLQRVQIVHFLRRLLKTPDDFAEHIRHLFAATITRIAYGTEIKEKDDEFVRLAEDGLLAFNTLLAPGKYLVELFPSLRFVPAWCPGAKFKREAARARVTVRNVLQLPWAHTLDAMSNGSVKNSMVTAFMEHIVQLHGQEAVQETEVAQNTVAVAYAAGADTTLSSIQAFFSIMASCPEVQRKAQAELDVVVGSTRLPDSPDIDALPYVSAVIKECLRWHTVVPLAVPHRLIEDDEYRGYLIPKGTLVIPNVCPFDFKPERFMKDGRLDPDILDPSEYAFGYGRRICPGQQFAQSSLFLIVSTVLHTMSITSPEGEDAGSRQLRAKGKVSDGIISYPEPFDCVITPRGLWAETLVLNGL
ncbi:hypothetical protein BN946_scf184921.g27 [Trametes cinnabarina]|uniref:Cytochrome P450 n=1 Tax=Pycnoporus cinnabarinus TaxID=5643 RepID=A0A060SNL4_PYCCI|nr:hypothetical protein BN946_scf184921.g27 [Trametes cinnabarina]